MLAVPLAREPGGPARAAGGLLPFVLCASGHRMERHLVCAHARVICRGGQERLDSAAATAKPRTVTNPEMSPPATTSIEVRHRPRSQNQYPRPHASWRRCAIGGNRV